MPVQRSTINCQPGLDRPPRVQHYYFYPRRKIRKVDDGVLTSQCPGQAPPLGKSRWKQELALLHES